MIQRHAQLGGARSGRVRQRAHYGRAVQGKYRDARSQLRAQPPGDPMAHNTRAYSTAYDQADKRCGLRIADDDPLMHDQLTGARPRSAANRRGEVRGVAHPVGAS
jgi:hypothetical protein